VSYSYWILVVAQLGHAQVGKDIGDFVKEHQKREREVMTRLQDPKLWNDPKQKDSLLEHIAAARAIRSRSFIPILVPHLTYSPFREGNAYMTIEERYPAMAVLLEVGTPSVPALIDVLKKADPDDDPIKNIVLERKGNGTGALEHGVALHCLVGIYSQGGAGKELAKLRIEIEINTAKDLDKMFLRRALGNGIFKQ